MNLQPKKYESGESVDVVIVAMADSIHTSRWIAQFSNQQISILLFPSSPHRRIHKDIKNLLNGDQVMNLTMAPMMKPLALPLVIIDTVFRSKIRATYLKYLIRKRKPRIIHGLETQHAGYLLSDAISKIKDAPIVYLSLWGSDLYWFGKFKKHHHRISQIMKKVDYLGVECKRDIGLASSFGFTGCLLPIVPASGGIDLESFDHFGSFIQSSERLKIMVKGYSGFVGKSLTSLRALGILSDELSKYEIIIYSASRKTVRHARRLMHKRGLNIVCYKKHALEHSKVISLLHESRLSISLSLSDGFSGSLRESMATGCFPVESINSCGSEWAVDGKTAFFVDPLNTEEIVEAVQIALRDDALVDAASTINREIIANRVSIAAVNEKMVSYYEILK